MYTKKRAITVLHVLELYFRNAYDWYVEVAQFH